MTDTNRDDAQGMFFREVDDKLGYPPLITVPETIVAQMKAIDSKLITSLIICGISYLIIDLIENHSK